MYGRTHVIMKGASECGGLATAEDENVENFQYFPNDTNWEKECGNPGRDQESPWHVWRFPLAWEVIPCNYCFPKGVEYCFPCNISAFAPKAQASHADPVS